MFTRKFEAKLSKNTFLLLRGIKAPFNKQILFLIRCHNKNLVRLRLIVVLGYLLQISYKFLTKGISLRRNVMVIGEKLPTSSTIIGSKAAISTKQVIPLHFCSICYSGLQHSLAGFLKKHAND